MLSIEKIGLAAAIHRILPLMAEAGDLACSLQGQISAGNNRAEQKDLGGAFSNALTDADILIESVVGARLFRMFDDIRFEGEEKTSDHIAHFFPQDAPYTVTFDPINGTRYYQDGLPVFDIILTVCRGTRIVAAVNYMPCTGKAYVAVEGEGARVHSGERFGSVTGLHLGDADPVILVNDTVLAAHQRAFEAAGYVTSEVHRDYRAQKDWRYACNAIFTGGAAAMCKTDAQLIDACAYGFIVKEAGGVWNDPVAELDSAARVPLLVSAVSPEHYDRIAAIVGA
jgi:fructose-1,6-bisphosphatase/inositol monophosphatase family enzyme